MKIELLLNRIAYDQAVRAGDRAFNGWLHGPASGDPDIKSRQLLPRFGLRKESWGGIFVYGPTAQVYAVDGEAYEYLEKVAAGESLDQLALTAGQGDKSGIESFRSRLTELGIVVPS